MLPIQVAFIVFYAYMLRDHFSGETTMGNTPNSSWSDESRAKKAFGQLVLRLRQERGWSQKHLDRVCNVPWRTILDIEHADKAVLDHRTVSALATAFQLTGLARREFFLTAGLKPDVASNPQLWQSTLQRFYLEHNYPAYVTDLALYIHSFNSYLADLLQFSPQNFLEKHRHYGHISALHFMFDPVFGTRELFRAQWDTLATIVVHYFHVMVETHRQDIRYSLTLSQLQPMRDFNRLWNVTKDLNTISPHLEPITAHHPKYKTLRFWHLQPMLPDAFFEEHRAILNPPADLPTEKAFSQMRLEVPPSVYTLPINT